VLLLDVNIRRWAYLLFDRRHCCWIVSEFWVFVKCVIVHPLAKVVGHVKSSIVVGTVLKVNYDQLFFASNGRFADQNVTLL
jgi:hypothetical protein